MGAWNWPTCWASPGCRGNGHGGHSTASGCRAHACEQLDHLLSLPHWRVALRVLPFEAAGLGATDAFTVAVLADDEGLVFVDATADGVLLDRPEDFVAYRRVFERLWEGALDEAASAEMIKSRR